MNRTAIATVNDLFTWYAGEDWHEDWQTTNTMTVDGVHAQDESEDGEDALKYLYENRDVMVNIEGIDEPWAWDLVFELNGRIFSMQSTDFYGESEVYEP